MNNDLKSFHSRFAHLEIAKGEIRDASRLKHTLSTAENSLKAFIQQSESEESGCIWDKSRESINFFLSAFAAVISVVADSQVSSSDGDFMTRAVNLHRQCLCKLEKELTYSLARDSAPLPAGQLASLADSGVVDAAVQLQLMSKETVKRVSEIVHWMVWGGGGKECCVKYAGHRQKVLEQNLADLDFPPPRTDAELRDLHWSSLVGDTGGCSQYVGVAVHALLSSERSLCDTVFATHTQVRTPSRQCQPPVCYIQGMM